MTAMHLSIRTRIAHNCDKGWRSLEQLGEGLAAIRAQVNRLTSAPTDDNLRAGLTVIDHGIAKPSEEPGSTDHHALVRVTPIQ